MSWRQRLRQATHRVWAGLCHPSDDEAARVLPPAAFALYGRMAPGDRQHALLVLGALRAEGPWSNDIEQAALLHDAGKSEARLTLAHRTLIVLLQRLAPGRLEQLATGETTGWRRPFYVQAHHAEIGATLCERAGCLPSTVSLVRAHQGADHAALPLDLRAAAEALQRADDRS